jgi:three-Cys-motif partner protein
MAGVWCDSTWATLGDDLGRSNLTSELKHALLRCYIPKFGGMTGSRGERQVVYFDGFAGEGRYENGKEGSTEIAMQVAAHHGRMGLRWKCFFTETRASMLWCAVGRPAR